MEYFDFENPSIQERLVAENDYAFAFLGKMPIVPGHTLICPKRAVPLSENLFPHEWGAILSLKVMVCDLLKIGVGAKGFNFAWNENTVAGQTVPHFHLHIVPRKEEDSGIVEYEPRVFLYRPGSRASSPVEELALLANFLRTLKTKMPS